MKHIRIADTKHKKLQTIDSIWIHTNEKSALVQSIAGKKLGEFNGDFSGGIYAHVCLTFDHGIGFLDNENLYIKCLSFSFFNSIHFAYYRFSCI